MPDQQQSRSHHRDEKHRKPEEHQTQVTYKQTSRSRFIPIILSSGGMMNEQTKALIKKIGQRIAHDKKDDSRRIIQEFKTEISVSLIRSRVNSIRTAKRNVAEQMQLLHTIF